MAKFLVTMKTIFYFVSLVMPVKDAIKGVLDGVKQAAKEKEYQREVKDIYQYIVDETTEEVYFLEKEDKK